MESRCHGVYSFILWRSASVSFWRCPLHERESASCPFFSAAVARLRLRSSGAASCQRPSSARPIPAAPASTPGRKLACDTCRSGILHQSAQAFSSSSFGLGTYYTGKQWTQAEGLVGERTPFQKTTKRELTCGSQTFMVTLRLDSSMSALTIIRSQKPISVRYVMYEQAAWSVLPMFYT